MTLNEGDNIAAFTVIPGGSSLNNSKSKNETQCWVLLCTKYGFMKRMCASQFLPHQSRTVKGRIGFIKTQGQPEHDEIASLIAVESEDSDILVASKNGVVKRLKVCNFTVRRRQSGGVKAINLLKGDSIRSLALAQGNEVDD